MNFQLDDRSQAGINNIWVVWTIKNNSPGQTTKGEYPTTLKSTEGIKLNITSFNRTAGY
ncbi:hypothetical protein [Streptomyces sp. LARHCF252]